MTDVRLAVDIGGTFTDAVSLDPSTGEVRTAKALSTPADLSEGVLAAIGQVVPPPRIAFLVHGTTAGLNAVLERRGARVALLTTDGFRDVYEIGRSNRPDMYNLFYRRPRPLVRRRDIFEVPERLAADGSVLRPLDPEGLEPILQRLRDGAYESVAVCFLHAYANPAHELLTGRLLRALMPGVSVSLSHQVAREWREYERTSTTVINAYIAPTVERYLHRLSDRLREAGYSRLLHVMQSNGGVMTAEAARHRPIQTLFSGPVGGAVGCAAVGRMTGDTHLIGIDMGGTSFDVSLVVDGQPDVVTEVSLEGFPILMPAVDIHTIGAGGGSIAWVESGGLRVGPRSAGADPGPACYGRGGDSFTVTDANVVLGRINPDYFLGGTMGLDEGAAHRAMERLAGRLGLDPTRVAEGVLDVVNASMANAIRALTVRRGIDPRGFSLVAFGGAGPLHAAFLARDLGIPRVIVPASPGTFSAWGMLQTDLRHGLVRTFYRSLDRTDSAEVEQAYRSLEEEGRAILRDEGVSPDTMQCMRTADMRYAGQEYTISISLPSPVDDRSLAALAGRFHDAYERRYGHRNVGEGIEFVALRVTAVGVLPAPPPPRRGKILTGPADPGAARWTVFAGERLLTRVYRRDALLPGQTLTGPAIVEEPSCTTVIPPGAEAIVDPWGQMVISLPETSD
ncbi:MAG: hydantoinase/oxoprolinase family protein [Armatimonadota bacterium]|nr:hydantoinase/oxoprolinase family protein [Armatimonadota bacterium]MDR7545297.1 hydantoinase/oxoprolinase family protein [Armatimonadota bacterium]MDR7612120.1 hydantoinase/oxoprolinase family protein [Armatimonadota bacterium]